MLTKTKKKCKNLKTKNFEEKKPRGPSALSLCLWCLPTSPDIQCSFMPNGHIAEVKYLVFLGTSLFIFICVTARSTPSHPQKWPWTLKGQSYPIYISTITPEFQMSLRLSVRTPVLELQVILRQVHHMTSKWPSTLKDQRYQFETWVRWLTGRFTKLSLLGMNLAKVPEVAHILAFYPTGSKWSLFLLYGQRFSRYGPILKISISGHETWPLTKDPEVAHYTLSTQEVENKLIFAL